MHCQNRFHRFWSRCLRGSPQRKKRLASVKQHIQDTSIRTSNGGPEFTGAHLAEKGYWEERYTKAGGNKHFDWLASGDTTLDLILPYLRPGAKVLDLGCGTSSFALQLARASPVPVQVPLSLALVIFILILLSALSAGLLSGLFPSSSRSHEAAV